MKIYKNPRSNFANDKFLFETTYLNEEGVYLTSDGKFLKKYCFDCELELVEYTEKELPLFNLMYTRARNLLDSKKQLNEISSLIKSESEAISQLIEKVELFSSYITNSDVVESAKNFNGTVFYFSTLENETTIMTSIRKGVAIESEFYKFDFIGSDYPKSYFVYSDSNPVEKYIDFEISTPILTHLCHLSYKLGCYIYLEPSFYIDGDSTSVLYLNILIKLKKEGRISKDLKSTIGELSVLFKDIENNSPITFTSKV